MSTTAAPPRTAHITVITRRYDRRIMGHGGSRRNLCGAAPTIHDMTVRQARRLTVLEAEEWHLCPTCIRELQRQEQNLQQREGR